MIINNPSNFSFVLFYLNRSLRVRANLARQHPSILEEDPLTLSWFGPGLYANRFEVHDFLTIAEEAFGRAYGLSYEDRQICRRARQEVVDNVS